MRVYELEIWSKILEKYGSDNYIELMGVDNRIWTFEDWWGTFNSANNPIYNGEYERVWDKINKEYILK